MELASVLRALPRHLQTSLFLAGTCPSLWNQYSVMSLLNKLLPCPPGHELHNLRIRFPTVYSEIIADPAHHMGYPPTGRTLPPGPLLLGPGSSSSPVPIPSLSEALPASSAGHIFATLFCVTALRCSPSWPRTRPVSICSNPPASASWMLSSQACATSRGQVHLLARLICVFLDYGLPSPLGCTISFQLSLCLLCCRSQ